MIWAVLAVGLALAPGASGQESCSVRAPAELGFGKDEDLRIAKISSEPNELKYSGAYRGVSFYLIISACESETRQLVVVAPANTNPWEVMNRLHILFRMSPRPIDSKVRSAVKGGGEYNYSNGTAEFDYELRTVGIVQFLSETITLQR